MKHTLMGQGMYREQENSHLEWPDHTEHFYSACSTAYFPMLFLPALNWADDPRQEIVYVVGKVIACSVAMSCKSFLCVHATTVTCLEAENE